MSVYRTIGPLVVLIAPYPDHFLLMSEMSASSIFTLPHIQCGCMTFTLSFLRNIDTVNYLFYFIYILRKINPCVQAFEDFGKVQNSHDLCTLLKTTKT